MASPVELYQREMHKNVGFFATWLPASILELGDLGVLEAGRFRRIGSLKELGITELPVREGTAGTMSYSASAERNTGVSAGASTALPVAKAELSIRFAQKGGYVFEATGIRNFEIADRMALADRILSFYEQGRWQKEWLLVDAVYRAASATVIVSEETSSEIVLKASGNIPLGSLPLTDPNLGLSVSSSHGKIVHVVAQNNLTPLYSGVKVRDPLIGSPSVEPVRGLANKGSEALMRAAIEELLSS
jgi:hypothetical protein